MLRLIFGPEAGKILSSKRFVTKKYRRHPPTPITMVVAAPKNCSIGQASPPEIS
jgi:hypothetical protein